jgi:hypothetical protein
LARKLIADCLLMAHLPFNPIDPLRKADMAATSYISARPCRSRSGSGMPRAANAGLGDAKAFHATQARVTNLSRRQTALGTRSLASARAE